MVRKFCNSGAVRQKRSSDLWDSVISAAVHEEHVNNLGGGGVHLQVRLYFYGGGLIQYLSVVVETDMMVETSSLI